MLRKLLIVLGALMLCALGALCASASAAGYPESAHPYADNSDLSWTYTHPSAANYLKITFSEDTETEYSDVLDLTDGSGRVMTFRSSMLAGRDVVVAGNSFTIRLKSDSSFTRYGFRITSVVKTTKADHDAPRYYASGSAICLYTGNAASLTVPASIDGRAITAIYTGAFQDHGEIKTVSFPKTLIGISWNAFKDCTGLTGIALPDSVTSIYDRAFSGCTSLKSVTLGKGLTYIGSDAFRGCSALTAVSIPDAVTQIASYAFEGCASLKTVALGKGLTTIDGYAFANCAALNDITIPDAVTVIGYYAFNGCTALKTVTIGAGSRLGKLGNCAFDGCSALRSIRLPETLTELGGDVFMNCRSLKSIGLPGSLTQMGGGAFWNCESLCDVSFGAGFSLSEIPRYTFCGCEALRTITLPACVTSLGESAFYACHSLEQVTFLSGRIALKDSALLGCYVLKRVDVPITAIEDDALPIPIIDAMRYINLGSLTSVSFDDSAPALSDAVLEDLKRAMYLTVTVGKNSPIYPQLKQQGICYRVRETGETNAGNLPTDYIRGKVEYIFRTCITSGMTDYEKALALHDWLVRNAHYDWSLKHGHASHILLEGLGVCMAYTSAYHILLEYAGIESDEEDGDDHTWNMVRLDGEWYHVDVTWDDDGDTSNYQFFGLSNYALEEIDNHECYEKPHIATAYKYNYLYRNGQYDSILSTWRNMIQDGLDANQTVITDKGYNRTCVLVLRDETFTWHGHPIHMDVDVVDDEMVFRCPFQAPDFSLPAGMKRVEDEAFEGIAAQVVFVPEGVTSIGAKAFAGCLNLWQVYIPKSVTSIADSAFSGAKNLMICGAEGSYAQTYAAGHKLTFAPVG